FTDATRLTGLSDEDSLFLLAAGEQIDLRGILLAGIIIGTIGVLDDVTVTQSAAVAEIHEADPTMSSGRLYRSALRVGRDHIGSTTNTLAFAYAGAALPLLLVLTQAQLNISTALTSEIIAIEIVRALVGGIGLVASVPITTALAAWAVHGGGEGPCAPTEPQHTAEPDTDPDTNAGDRFDQPG
ncbi:MAG: YibE/F family protein, partial [Acidimicrobiales bacterium]